MAAGDTPEESRVVRQDGTAIRLSNRFVAMLLAFDGQTSPREIAEEISRFGPEAQPELVEKLATQMAAHDIVEWISRICPVEVYGEPHHTCRNCGASCEHHLIGPLPPERKAQIRRDHARLSQIIPHLADQSPLMPMPDGEGEALRVIDGRCVFLDDDRLCLLHTHHGPESKPLTCQTFPLVTVETENEIRLGVQPSCYTLHHTFQDGDPVAIDAAETAPGYRPPSSSIASPALSPGFPDTPMDQEAALLRWLSEPDLTIPELLARVVGRPPQRPPRTEIPTRATRAIRKLLVRVGSTQTAALALRRSDTFHHTQLAKLFQGLAALDEEPGGLHLPEPYRRYLHFCIGQGIFIRQTGRLASPQIGALVLCLGAVSAWWVSSPVPSDVVDDAFARAFVAFNRQYVFAQAFGQLFSGPQDLLEILEAWD